MITRGIVVTALVSCAALAGCTIYGPHQIAASNRPTTAAGATNTFVRGESCQPILFGIPLSDGNTVRAALDDAKKRAGTNTLTDITVDRKVFFLLIYARQCTIVQGVPVAG